MKCLLDSSAITRDTCLSQPDFKWYPGYFWLALYISNDTCTGYCDGNPFAFDQASCTAKGTCSAFCPDCTGLQCSSLGTCVDGGGSCITQEADARQSCRTGFRWTPYGCANSSIDTFILCNETGGVWYPPSKDEASCLNTQICRSANTVAGAYRVIPRLPSS